MTKLSDEWQTPQCLFDELNEEFHFDVDLCATAENSKCDFYYEDYLTDDSPVNKEYNLTFNPFKNNIICFINPPYSNPKPFIEKAWEDSKYCKIVCLVKCDPSTRWWATFWNYEPIYNMQIKKDYEIYGRGPKPGCEVRYFPKRIKFDPPQQLIDSGEVWKEKGKWMEKCNRCCGVGECNLYGHPDTGFGVCHKCAGKGYKELSGPTFSSALLIFDRRGV